MSDLRLSKIASNFCACDEDELFRLSSVVGTACSRLAVGIERCMVAHIVRGTLCTRSRGR